MEEYETEPDVPCLVCYDLRLPTHSGYEPDWFKRQRKLARELSGYDPFDGYCRLFVEPKSLDTTAAAGCLSCVLLKDIWGRLCITEELCLGKGDMEGRHGFFLHTMPRRMDTSKSHVLLLCLKDHEYVIHTFEGEPCPWDTITSLPWSGYLPSLDQVRLFVEDAFDHRPSYMQVEHELPVLPARLVMLHDGQPQGNVGPAAPLEIRLIQTSSIAQTLEDDVRYVALSHCWGSPDVAAQVMQTTTETIGAFFQSIPWGGLTKTFQDAMLVAKHLGIRYIWIDSLCIVQDDARDWAVEASRMASVYVNAHLTISAMEATDGHQGLYINTGSKPILRRGVHEIKLPGLEYPIYVRSNEFHESAISALDLKPIEMPLLHRGWAFQERILSPFVLHFTESELIFEDKRGGSPCECKVLGHYIEGTQRLDGLPRTGTSSFRFRLWYYVVEIYASRLLTFEADRLPALSGIATTFERQWPALGSYLAGIWETDILGGLHWSVSNTVRPRPQPKIARGTLLSAPPTWSWASVGTSNISWHGYDRYYSLVEITSATCFALTSDDKGMVAGGRITLRGRLCLAVLDLSPYRSESDSGSCSISLANESLANNAHLTFFEDVRLCSDGKALPAVYYFLPLALHQKFSLFWDLFGLVLCRETKGTTATNRVEHSSKDTATFSRVGCAIIAFKNQSITYLDEDEAVAWFSDWRNTVFNNFGQEQVLAIV